MIKSIKQGLNFPNNTLGQEIFKSKLCIILGGTMKFINESTLKEIQNYRYATKQFDSTKKISEETWAAIEQSLIDSPSSYGLQPWKFVVITDPAVKKAIRPHSWNQSQTEDCSHYLVICAKEKMDAAHVGKFVDRMVEVRGGERAQLEGYEKMMNGDVVTGPRSQVSFEWAARRPICVRPTKSCSSPTAASITKIRAVE